MFLSQALLSGHSALLCKVGMTMVRSAVRIKYNDDDDGDDGDAGDDGSGDRRDSEDDHEGGDDTHDGG